MRVSSINDVKVYAVNTSKTLPEWITDKKKRKLLKSDPELRGRVNLIQDFEFPTAATNINITEDGNYILATGIFIILP
jgi:ribosome biogenesis protein ENP2